MNDIPDDLSTTVSLQPGSPVDSYADEADVDVVRVTLTANQFYVFDMLGASSGGGLTLEDPELALLDDAGNLIAYDDDGGNGLDASITYVAARSGTFYLAAAGLGTVGTYRLNMLTTAPRSDDFGQTPATAGAVAPGDSRSGSIGAGFDQDWFGIALSAGQSYRFAVQALAAQLDPILSVYSASGVLLDVNDDESDVSTDSVLLFTPETSGTYYLGVAGYEGSTGAYQVSARTAALDILDTMATTASLPVNGTLGSAIDIRDDADAIRVELVGGQNYTIDMLGANAGTGLTLADPFLLLLDSAFNLLAVDDDSGSGNDARVTFTPSTSGTYYIGALASDGGVGTYRLTLSVAVGAVSGGGVVDDFDGSGASDILWQNGNGSISSWSVAGSRIGYNSYFASVDPRWNVVETFDMNGDGRADILWRNADGSVAVWQANGVGGTGNSYFHAPVDTAWKVIGLADFNGDGRDDLLWRNDNGAISEWLSSGAGFQENSLFDASVPTSWHIRGLADLNGDGRDDIVWRNDDGELSTWLSRGGDFIKNAFSTRSVGTDWQVAQTGDYNGDGRADLLWRNAGGAISVWQSNGTGFDQNSLFDGGPSAGWQIQSHDFLL